MSNAPPEARSYISIQFADLRRLLKIAKQDRAAFFTKHPQWSKLYANRVICIALCQGAALHYLDQKTGINDFDVYTFYQRHPARELPYRRLKYYDFGNPKFGRSSNRLDFVGRRVDCLMRSIEWHKTEDPAVAIRRYLEGGKTQTAKLLASKAVVLLEPNLGKVVWPI